MIKAQGFPLLIKLRKMLYDYCPPYLHYSQYVKPWIVLCTCIQVEIMNKNFLFSGWWAELGQFQLHHMHCFVYIMYVFLIAFPNTLLFRLLLFITVTSFDTPFKNSLAASTGILLWTWHHVVTSPVIMNSEIVQLIRNIIVHVTTCW